MPSMSSQPADNKPRKRTASGTVAGADVSRTKIESTDEPTLSFENYYNGWTVPATGNPTLERICFREQCTPSSFYEKFVAKRKPVVIVDAKGPDDNWRGHSKWNVDYLRKVAGEGEVRIEHRDSDQSKFGQGNHSKVKFSKFLDIVEGKADGREGGEKARKVYLTTQDLGMDDEGRPYLHSTPCTQLLRAGDFPPRPMMLDRLVPMNYNLWIGSTSTEPGSGSSSGLHHDFHDNLYILLSGRKTFRLFSPADAERMYTVGQIHKVHANGRICYSQDGQSADDIEADGSDKQARLAMEAAILHEKAEKQLADAERDVEAGVVRSGCCWICCDTVW